MKILIDTNTLLDLFLDRMPFSESAAQLISLIEMKRITGCISATSVTTIAYYLQKYLEKEKSREAMKEILSLFEVAEINKKILIAAQKSEFNDFEDAVIYEAAKAEKVEAIVTRNKNDFEPSKISVFNAEEFLNYLKK
ncbi:MAG: PIN domain-containing protein [bacterium]